MQILQVQGLRKKYGSTLALQGLDLSIASGQIFGILGPNGSGKTTTLGILLGVLSASSGRYSWFDGMSHHKARRRIGSLLETPKFYPYLSARDNLKITASIRGASTKKISEVLEMVGLSERAGDKFREYSLGMKQRLAIAAALLGNPEVLIFDEPTNGIDAKGIVEIRNLITSIGSQGKTIILASHILDEVEKVCSHVAILKQGNLISSGPIGEVLTNDSLTIELAAADLDKLEAALGEISTIQNPVRSGLILTASAKSGIDLAAINKQLFDQGIVLSHIAEQKKSLETRFLELTEGS